MKLLLAVAAAVLAASAVRPRQPRHAGPSVPEQIDAALNQLAPDAGSQNECSFTLRTRSDGCTVRIGFSEYPASGTGDGTSGSKRLQLSCGATQTVCGRPVRCSCDAGRDGGSG